MKARTKTIIDGATVVGLLTACAIAWTWIIVQIVEGTAYILHH